MNKLTRISATVASSVALVAGFAGVAAAAPSISHTGFDSTNRISHTNRVRTDVRNRNNVDLTSNNPQTARSGNVRANENTTADDVSSGQAWNDSLLDASVSLDNTSAASDALDSAGGGGGSDGVSNASIDTTGADSLNTIRSTNTVTTNVTNDNRVDVTSNNRQTAASGNVTADRNTTVGDVTSGDASNTSTTTLSVDVSN